MNRVLIAALPFLACGSGCAPLHWERSGADAATRDRDLNECRKDARAKAAGRTWSSETLSRQVPLEGLGDLAVPAYADSDASGRSPADRDLVYRCMREKGYGLVPATATPPAEKDGHEG
jgi:hypothetical protein